MNFPGRRRVCPDHISLQPGVSVILTTCSLLDRDKLEAQVGTEGRCKRGFPGGSVVKNLPANAGDSGDPRLIPGSGRCPGGGHGNPPQCSCLENHLDRGAWRATVHEVAACTLRCSFCPRGNVLVCLFIHGFLFSPVVINVNSLFPLWCFVFFFFSLFPPPHF